MINILMCVKKNPLQSEYQIMSCILMAFSESLKVGPMDVGRRRVDTYLAFPYEVSSKEATRRAVQSVVSLGGWNWMESDQEWHYLLAIFLNVSQNGDKSNQTGWKQ